MSNRMVRLRLGTNIRISSTPTSGSIPGDIRLAFFLVFVLGRFCSPMMAVVEALPVPLFDGGAFRLSVNPMQRVFALHAAELRLGPPTAMHRRSTTAALAALPWVFFSRPVHFSLSGPTRVRLSHACDERPKLKPCPAGGLTGDRALYVALLIASTRPSAYRTA